MVNVGIIGIGGIGRVHFNCYKNNPAARIAAICDIDERKRIGDWSAISLNIDPSKTPLVDLSGIMPYEKYTDLLANPEIEIVDICLPTPLHAEVTIAALRAGKHVLCEKPMVRYEEQIAQVIDAHHKSGRNLLIGHCLRYWGEYERTAQIIASGEYGRPLYAKLVRTSATPRGAGSWFRDGEASGGTVLDMHIHDIDAVLWWFGKPDQINATGRIIDGLPVLVDASWTYKDGPGVHIHSIWDKNQPPFRFAFHVILENATIDLDSAVGGKLMLYQADKEPVTLECDPTLAYQREIDDFIDAAISKRPITRVTPEASGDAVKAALEEIRQIKAKG
ncbi:MAG: Gfo/Idh/MocA family oxidoreductase [Capsulimonadaceae bacterium]|nr:Gfo/Idh/MocA family oxidoreductase [Capsulimonadaceae bacterium]